MRILPIVQTPSTCNCTQILDHLPDNHPPEILEFVAEFGVLICVYILVADQPVCEDFEVSEHFDSVFDGWTHCRNGCSESMTERIVTTEVNAICYGSQEMFNIRFIDLRTCVAVAFIFE